jgi:hypothetical protein
MARGQTISIDVPMLFRLHAEGRSREEICTALGIRLGSWWRVSSRYRLPKRERVRRVEEQPVAVDPTPQEIEERCLAIRSSWSPAEEERRIVGSRAKRVEAPYYCFGRQEAAFCATTPLRYLTIE